MYQRGATGQIFMKFDTGDFYEIVSKIQIWLVSEIMSDTLHEDSSIFYCYQCHYIAIKAVFENEMVSYSYDNLGGIKVKKVPGCYVVHMLHIFLMFCFPHPKRWNKI
jgi:hypothetical protein